MKRYAIGTDIGGSHISAVLVDVQKECIVEDSFSSKPVDNHAAANVILDQWSSALRNTISIIGKEELLGIGFAMPGPFDYAKGVALFKGNAKYESLYGINVARWLHELLNLNEDTYLRFMNDATSFAVGEAWIGKTSGYKKSMAITLGTGFGSAFIESGIPVLEGPQVPDLGCVWHLPYKNGIADDYFSTRWFEKQYAERTGKKVSGVKELAHHAQTDPIAKELFMNFGYNLGQFLGPWMKSFGADSLVLGGNIAGAYHLFQPSFSSQLSSQGIKTNINISELKETAAMVGSAKLFNDDFWTIVKPLLSKM